MSAGTVINAWIVHLLDPESRGHVVVTVMHNYLHCTLLESGLALCYFVNQNYVRIYSL